jgi:hypothetical protein
MHKRLKVSYTGRGPHQKTCSLNTNVVVNMLAEPACSKMLADYAEAREPCIREKKRKEKKNRFEQMFGPQI